MSFIVRSIHEDDYEDILALARQFTFLNLPADPKILKKKIQRSVQSFAGKLAKDEAEYLFVKLVACSSIGLTVAGRRSWVGF